MHSDNEIFQNSGITVEMDFFAKDLLASSDKLAFKKDHQGLFADTPLPKNFNKLIASNENRWILLGLFKLHFSVIQGDLSHGSLN